MPLGGQNAPRVGAASTNWWTGLYIWDDRTFFSVWTVHFGTFSLLGILIVRFSFPTAFSTLVCFVATLLRRIICARVPAFAATSARAVAHPAFLRIEFFPLVCAAGRVTRSHTPPSPISSQGTFCARRTNHGVRALETENAKPRTRTNGGAFIGPAAVPARVRGRPWS